MITLSEIEKLCNRKTKRKFSLRQETSTLSFHDSLLDVVNEYTAYTSIFPYEESSMKKNSFSDIIN